MDPDSNPLSTPANTCCLFFCNQMSTACALNQACPVRTQLQLGKHVIVSMSCHCCCVYYLAQARQVGGIGGVFAGASITAVLCLLCNRGPGGGFESTQVHDSTWWHHVLSTHVCQGALLKPVEIKLVAKGRQDGRKDCSNLAKW